MITKAQALLITAAWSRGTPLPLLGETVISARYEGKVYSKARPRMGAHSVYTPKNTRLFEKAVRNFFVGECASPVDFPVSVRITLWDKIAKSTKPWLKEHMYAGNIFSMVGDVDNRAKSIMDAGNDVLLVDDKFISSMYVNRQFDSTEGFSIIVKRSGFSLNELEMIRGTAE